MVFYIFQQFIQKLSQSVHLFVVFCCLFSFDAWAAKKNSFKSDIDTIAVDEVISIVGEKYIKDVPVQNLIESALLGIMQSLDSYSDYLSPADYREFKVATSGRFSGIGVEMIKNDGLIIVSAVLPSSPAMKEGIKVGDVILEVDGKDVTASGTSLIQVGNMIRGMDGSVKLKILRRINGDEKEMIRFTVKRMGISVPSVYLRVIEGGIVVFRVTAFTRETTASIIDSIKYINKKYSFSRLNGMIVDLRGNPGGLFEQAVSFSDIFLNDKQKVATLHGKNGEEISEFYTSIGSDMSNGMKMVVLVNGDSASASEVVAGAFHDNKRAVIVGQKTYGKGVVQDFFELFSIPDSAIKMTFAEYRTPNGTIIHENGIIPDVLVAGLNENNVPSSNVVDMGIKESTRLLLDDELYFSVLNGEIDGSKGLPSPIITETLDNDKVSKDEKSELSLDNNANIELSENKSVNKSDNAISKFSSPVSSAILNSLSQEISFKTKKKISLIKNNNTFFAKNNRNSLYYSSILGSRILSTNQHMISYSNSGKRVFA